MYGHAQHDFLHRLGSSHGESRIIRPTYAERHYTALMPAAYALWERAQREAGARVYTQTGGLDFGPWEGEGMRSVRAAAQVRLCWTLWWRWTHVPGSRHAGRVCCVR